MGIKLNYFYLSLKEKLSEKNMQFKNLYIFQFANKSNWISF